MLSFCRSGLLALTLVSGCVANVEAQVQRSLHKSWVSDVSIERLQDKSVLTEYFGETQSEESEEITFRVGFIPRFGCAPLITYKFGKNAASGLLPVVQPLQIDSLSVFIDGSKLAFPALADENADHHSIYMNADLQRRITAKIRIEVGNKMVVRPGVARQLSFSLQGSRDAISIANQNCRRHDPSNQG